MKLLSKLNIFLMVLFASIFLFLFAYFYYQSESDEIIKEKHDFLHAVTNLKLEQAIKWKKERTSDAQFFPTISTFIKYTHQLNTNNSIVEAKEYFLKTLIQFTANGYDENIVIADIEGKILFSLDKSLTQFDSDRIEEIKGTIKSDTIGFGDFYFDGKHEYPLINIVSVIKDNNKIPIGSFIQQVDPSKTLISDIKKWPTTSKTAEILLFKKEKDHVVYLNELRHKKNSTLKLKIPLTQTDIVAVKGILGKSGIIEGKDYRGINVLADLRPIPGTDWYLVSKIDKDELLSEIIYRAEVLFIIIFISILLFTITALYIYKLQQSRIYKNLFLKQKELSETQEEYRTALYSIGDAAITTDTLGKIKQMNSVAETLTGWKENEVKGKSLSAVFNVINEETNEPVENPVARVLRAGVVVGPANHTMLISKDGNKIPIDDSGSPIKNTDGKIIGVVLVFRDQTEEREKGKILFESNEKFSKIFHHSSDSISLTQLSTGKLSEVNEGFEKIFGYSRSEAIGKTTFDLGLWANPNDRAKMFELLKQNGNIKNFEAIGNHRNGKQITALLSGEILEFNGEQYLLLSLKDISERKLAEEVIKNSEANLDSLINNRNEAIWSIDKDYNYVVFNNFFSKAYFAAYNKKLAKGINALNILTPELKAFWKPKYDAALSGERIEFEFSVELSNGIKYFQVLLNPIVSDSAVTGVTALSVDITQRKQAEETVRRSENLLAVVFNNSQDLQLLLSIEQGDILRVAAANKQYIESVRGFGFDISVQNIVGQTLEYLNKNVYGVPGELHEITLQRYRQVAASALPLHYEEELETPKGHYYGEISLVPVLDPDGTCKFILYSSHNVTERKRSEKALRENQLRLQSIVSNAPVVIFGLDKNGIFTFSEGKGLEALGLKPGEVVGLSAFEMYKDHPAVVEAIQHTLMGEMNSAIHDLGHLVFDVNYAPVKNELGEILGIIGVATDITKRVHAERWVTESEKQLSALMEGTKALLFSTDNRGRFVYVNQAVSEVFDIPVDELLGSFYLTLVHPEDRKRVHEKYYDQIKNSIDNSYLDFRYQGRNNKTGWLSFFVNPVIKEGKVVGLTGVAQDITERKQFQEASFKSEERLRLSLSAANQGLYDLNIQTGEAIVNDEYASMLGYDPKTFRENNENWIERLHPDDRESTTKAYLDYIEGKTSEYRVEFRQRTKNSEWKWILSLGKIIEYDSAGKPLRMLGTHTDMTEQKRLTLELIEAKEKAEEMNRVKAYFYANMSHELRTPFVGIMGFSEILSESLQNPAEKEMAVQILKSSKRLTDTLNKILNVTRLEFDKVDLKMSDVDVVELIKQLTILFSKSAFIKNTEIKTEFNPNIIRVKTDGKLLEEILTNLINNAIKFTENGLIKISAESMIENDEDYLILKVSDTGVGIPKEKHKIIWQEFRQVSEGMNRSFEGTGLGLTIIKKYINSLGGKIFLDSEVGEGATFTIKIPAKNLGKKEIIIRSEGVTEQPKNYDIPKNRKPKILYIEDDIVALSYVDKVLRNIYEIDTAFNATIALNLAKKNRYEVLMLDINLGRGIDGIELMHMLRKIEGYAKIPMVAVTAYAANSDKAEFLAKGFTHYISKPFTSVELKNILSSIFS